ncbi:hypothetical protein [Streptomyces sp. MK37H]|uniref:hypothetical protein n=1 Tax=Streptomyces sp. MK37H TaxID=2699117 RepID=UPI001B36ACC9|nr:hypothetical protein [Streptomyces sp. MK37H]MBP8532375.1 hypothetical protein [Streptomyces sp. MK37H]
MSDDPIIPARVYPAGTPLPPAAGAPPQPPLGPDFIPPWRAAPPPPPAKVPPPAAIEVHHVHTHIVVAPEPELEGPSIWERLADWIRPRQTIIGLAAAVVPYPAYGHSLATAWAATLSDARDTGSIGAAYALAGVALTIALLINRRRHTWWARALLATAVIGGTGALGWYDPITLLTGVRP